MTDIVERLDNCTSRFVGESQDDATIRLNRTVADARTEIASLRAERDKAIEGLERIAAKMGCVFVLDKRKASDWLLALRAGETK